MYPGYVLDITLSQDIRLPSFGFPKDLMKFLKEFLVFQNPLYYQRIAQGYGVWGIPRWITCMKKDLDGIAIPRGMMRKLIVFCKQKGIPYRIIDERVTLPLLALQSSITLHPFQHQLVKGVLTHDFGVLVAPPGTGKTVIALKTIAERKQTTLIIVHTKELLHQWRAQIKKCLALSDEDIGIIGDTAWKVSDVTVATIQTLRRRKEELKDLTQRIGYIIVDECHRVPAETFRQVVSRFPTRYMLGLTATPTRKDGLTKLLYAYMGEKVGEVTRAQLKESAIIVKPVVIIRNTSTRWIWKRGSRRQSLNNTIVKSPVRNGMMVKDVMQEAREGNQCLIISERKEHCRILHHLLVRKGITSAILLGDTSRKERDRYLAQLREKALSVVIATGQLLGEGFDYPNFSALFLVYPIVNRKRLIQYIGRVQRTAHDKHGARVYDYVDDRIEPLKAMAERRMQIYRGLGLQVRDEGHPTSSQTSLFDKPFNTC